MVTKQITLNIWQENTYTLILNQGEVNSRYIEVVFKSVNENLNLTDKQVTFYVEKPDGTIIFNNCDINVEQNIASVIITSQMVSTAGILECEFQIFDNKNSLLKVNGLKIMVMSDKDFSDAIESTSEFNALIQAINAAQSTYNKLESYLGEANNLSTNIGILSDLTTTEKSSLVGAVNEVNTSLNGVSNTIGDMNTVLGNLSGTVSNTTTSLNNVSNTVNEMNNSLNDVTNTVNEVNNSLNDVNNAVDQINSDLNEVNTSITQLNSKIIPISQGGTGTTTLKSAKEVLGILSETILYSNESGTQGTITLSDSVQNYDYIEIYYRNDSSNFKSVKIDNPSGKAVALENIGHYSNESYLRASVIILDNNTAVWQGYLTGFQVVKPDGSVSASANNLIHITKIIGYSN